MGRESCPFQIHIHLKLREALLTLMQECSEIQPISCVRSDSPGSTSSHCSLAEVLTQKNSTVFSSLTVLPPPSVASLVFVLDCMSIWDKDLSSHYLCHAHKVQLYKHRHPWIPYLLFQLPMDWVVVGFAFLGFSLDFFSLDYEKTFLLEGGCNNFND